MTIHAKTKPKCRQVTNATRNICLVRQTGKLFKKISGTLIKLANSDCTTFVVRYYLILADHNFRILSCLYPL